MGTDCDSCKGCCGPDENMDSCPTCGNNPCTCGDGEKPEEPKPKSE
jgi:hypothetical protein